MNRCLLVFGLAGLVCFSGCGLFRSAGQGTSDLFNRMVSSGTQRTSALDEIEKDDPEYLLDTVFRKNRSQQKPGQNQNEAAARQMIVEADQLYQQAVAQRKSQSGDHVAVFLQAGKKYASAADRWINSTLEQDSLFKAGECYFFADHLKKSNDYFERLAKDYPGTRYMDVLQARRFTIAEYWMQASRSAPQNPVVLNLKNEKRPLRDTAGNAIRILDRIRLDDPTGKLADDATLALANAYFDRQRYMDAADTYEDLRVNFPNSEHQFHAHLFEMKARLQAYQGPHYDGTHLATADKLLRAMVIQFPREAEEQSELLTRENARIRKMKAEREMALASYYEARGAYQAAGLHYREVQGEFRNTPVADEAGERLAKISDKPPRSNDPPQWVANLFPEPKATEPLLGETLKDQIR
ncbi:MAG: outer membrane protein assembly factor BamD [Planctomycetota bacterium]|nr:outer membrane protein assembly factor BamD [Planctomycetota bacterium]